MDQHRTVLFLEDDPDLQLFVQKSLGLKGIEVLGAKNAEDALMFSKDVQIVLSDLTLPDMEFADFWAKFRSKNTTAKRTPLIVASGRDDAGEQAENFGALALLKKPYSLKDLWETVAAVFSAIEEQPVRSTG